MKISGIIITLNEEENVNKALESLNFCDEIIVVDGGSTDKTVDIVDKNPKVILFERHLESDYSAQRNFALSKALGDWIIFLDADEIIEQSLKDEIRDFVSYRGENYGGGSFKRVDYLWDRPLKFGESGKIK